MKSNLVNFFDRFLPNHMQDSDKKDLLRKYVEKLQNKGKVCLSHIISFSMFIQKRMFNKEDAVFKNRSIATATVQRSLISEKKIIELLKSKTNDATTQLMIEISIFTVLKPQEIANEAHKRIKRSNKRIERKTSNNETEKKGVTTKSAAKK